MTKRQKIRKGLILVSFFLFPAIFYYFSPVIILVASSKGIINGSFIVFASMFLIAMLFGRGFCGWLCPAAGCQEAIFIARDKKVTRGDAIKWIIWVPWIIAIIILAVRAGGYHSVDFFYLTTYGLSVTTLQALITYFMVLFLLIVIPAFVFGKRAFCHHLCWMAPFMIIGRRIRNIFNWASLQLKVTPEVCKLCNLCDKHCPMSLQVQKMVQNNKMENAECILCGTCLDVCKEKAIRFDWGKRK
ncbi:MAG: 4Fe-4S binding protein [Thermodesulfovibrionales bacterium]|nr:4Fe-4S binding protein [Thermodesulfovibrionales bacterium]